MSILTGVIFVVVAAVCAFLLAYVMTPAVRVLAFRIGAVDVPLDGRRIHKKPIPRIGGLSIYLAFTVTTMLFCDFSRELVTLWVGGLPFPWCAWSSTRPSATVCQPCAASSPIATFP